MSAGIETDATDPLAGLETAVAELKAAAEAFRDESEVMTLAECVQAQLAAFEALRFGIEVRTYARIGLRQLQRREKVRSIKAHQKEEFRSAVDEVLLRVGIPSRELAEEIVRKQNRKFLRYAAERAVKTGSTFVQDATTPSTPASAIPPEALP